MTKRTPPKVSGLVGAPRVDSHPRKDVFLGSFDSGRDKSVTTVVPTDRNTPRLARVKLSLIDESEDQNRLVYDEDSLQLLGETLRVHQVEPIVLREKPGGRYEMRAGHRRRRAAMMVDMPDLLALIYAVDADVDNDRIGLDILVSNEQRESLGDFERAIGYQRKLDQSGISQVELARRLGIDRSLVAKRLAFFRLPQSAQDALRKYPRAFSHRFVPEILDALARAPSLEGDLVKGIVSIGAGESRPDVMVRMLSRQASQQALGGRPMRERTERPVSAPSGRHVCTVRMPTKSDQDVRIKPAKGVNPAAFAAAVEVLIRENTDVFHGAFEASAES